MRVVYKYRLPAVGRNGIEMPFIAEPLHVAEQDGDIMLWALVEVGGNRPPVLRVFNVWVTGLVSDDPGRYIGTVHCVAPPNEGVVLHVFEGA